MTSRPIRVMCVDDNQLVAEALERRIADEPKFTWAGWSPSTIGLLDLVRANQPDVVLFDIDMPGRDPFEVVQEMAETIPDSRAVMFSGYVRGDYVDRAIESGAWGYLSKNAGVDEVLTAIEQVANGGFAMSPEALADQHRQARGLSVGQAGA